MEINLYIEDQQEIELKIEGQNCLNLDIGGEFYGHSPIYTGEYEFTPTNQEQIVPISGLRATRDIRINPIPQNYGLITWNGSTLTVS